MTGEDDEKLKANDRYLDNEREVDSRYIDDEGCFMWRKAFSDLLIHAEGISPRVVVAWLREMKRHETGEASGLYWVILELAVNGVRWRAHEQEESSFSNN